MIDRIFMPALTFTILVAGFAAFVPAIAGQAFANEEVIQLERVVVIAQAERPAAPTARAEAADATTALR